MTLGFMGIGKMGSRMVEKLVGGGHELHVWNRSPEPIEKLKAKGLSFVQAPTIPELISSLPTPRVVWMMLPAGEITEMMYKQLLPLLAPGDTLVDGGNAHFEDTERRYQESGSKKIGYLGIGVSGGIIALKEGYPLMVGGDKTSYESISPILDTLGAPHGGHAYLGTGGAGHFVKMVHNGIEYAYMQALGEGFEVLSKSTYDLDLLAVAKIYQKGSLLSGFMVDRTVDALTPDPTLSGIVGQIDASGEAQWTVDQAKKEGVAVDLIERALEYRKNSKTDLKIQQSYTAKLVSALRNAFGGHVVTKVKS